MSVLPKSLHELTISECIEWCDQPRVAECEKHMARLGEWIDMLGTRTTHAAKFARTTLTAELERVQALLDSRPSIETERKALADAHAAWCAHIAEPAPLDTEGELRRLATRNVLDRARVAAYNTFLAAAQRATVRVPQDLAPAWAHACTESADLAATAHHLTDRYHGYGYACRAVDLAARQARAYTDSHGHLGLALYVVSAVERETNDATRALFALRWHHLARRAGIEGAKLPDLSKWERAA